MDRWSVLALALAVAMLTGPALAQTTGGGTSQTPMAPSTSGGEAAKPDAMKSDPSKAGRAARTGNREQVKAAQEALKQKGFDPGAADGMMGPKTQAALKEFQKSEQLNETGRLDAETMAKLGVQAKADGASPSASPTTSPTKGR
ncbi:MAG TPA: peptidoglycan-binding domain-containing protein [Methylomirabilota bacterium]|nr:peptidoglycan-binding domain-containing protein [Methylomirabilota bacterium]